MGIKLVVRNKDEEVSNKKLNICLTSITDWSVAKIELHKCRIEKRGWC